MPLLQRGLWAVLLGALLQSASGVVLRPAGVAWAYVYDLGLDNAVYLAGAALCWRAFRRVLTGALRVFRERGVAVSIHDCGTGYSSLASLQDLPADELKIDQVFVADVRTEPAARAIVEHTVSSAHVLGLRVVAEGVEDGETLPLAGFLAHLGVQAQPVVAGCA